MKSSASKAEAFIKTFSEDKRDEKEYGEYKNQKECRWGEEWSEEE